MYYSDTDREWKLTPTELEAADRADQAEREAVERAEHCATVCGLDWNADNRGNQ